MIRGREERYFSNFVFRLTKRNESFRNLIFRERKFVAVRIELSNLREFSRVLEAENSVVTRVKFPETCEEKMVEIFRKKLCYRALLSL